MQNLKPIFISGQEYDNNLLGFLNLTTDEQIAKKIFEATGDKVFKAFPIGWKTE